MHSRSNLIRTALSDGMVTALLVLAAVASADEHIQPPTMLEEGLSLLYPTPVLRSDLNEQLPAGTRESLRHAVLRAWDEYSAQAADARGAGGGVLGARGDATDFRRNDGFFHFQKEQCGEVDHRKAPAGWMATAAAQDLLEAMRSSTDAYLHRLDYEGRFGRPMPELLADNIHMWASLHTRCSTHPRHVHPGAVVSGVFYVALPAGAGEIAFADPRGQVPPFERAWHVAPREGELLLFPPWLGHEVTSNCAAGDGEPRISISFNYVDDDIEDGAWGEATAGLEIIGPREQPCDASAGAGVGGALPGFSPGGSAELARCRLERIYSELRDLRAGDSASQLPLPLLESIVAESTGLLNGARLQNENHV